MATRTMTGALRLWVGRLAAATLLLAVAGPGHAAVYVGNYDPQFGAPFTSPPGPFNLGWSGQVTVSVPGACVGLDQIVSTSDGGSCDLAGGAQMLSAYVDLFNWDDRSNPSNPFQRLTLNAASLDIFRLQFDAAGKLVNLDTTRSNTVSGSPFIDAFGLGEKFFGLGFVIQDTLCAGDPACLAGEPDSYSGPVLGFQGFTADTCGEACQLADVRQFPPKLVFTPVDNPVPAPPALLLALTALAAAGTASMCKRGCPA